MTQRPNLLALAISGTLALALASCGGGNRPPAATGVAAVPANESPEQFVARVNKEMREVSTELNSAQWLSNTYINSDSELIAAKANERWLTRLNEWIAQAKQFEGKPMSPETARQIKLLKLMTAMPAPRDPKELAELAQIASKLEGMYGSGSYCTGSGADKTCRDIGQLSDVLASSRDYDAQLDAWQGWHSVGAPMRGDYTRFVELVNKGAKEMGFADAGEMWRSSYDMPPAEFARETDRLWEQVKPLYEQLHCYARGRLDAKYGKDKVEIGAGMLPAHLMGNQWQQDWSNLWDILAPYPNAGSLDVNAALQRTQEANFGRALFHTSAPGMPASDRGFLAQRAASLATANQMMQRAQDFYTSLGMPALPESFWQKTQFIKPLDRDVMCHASAWDMNMQGDVRIKMCINPTEEDLSTIYHEMGHIYYYLAYNKLPPLLQGGANDGFHEAIGDTIVLSMTPQYLASVGLVAKPQQTHDALVNAQMRMALSKVAFLPFGLMIDRWRWGVFDGSITPDHYNQAWWALKAKYQGIAPISPRGEEFFDPGAKYHVPANTPYTRYFLANILQFQFYKALCDASGYTGPLYECSFYGNKEAGRKYWAMLARGASQPWQASLKELTGSDQLDAKPLLDYFAPLQAWLKEQNAGQACGWQPDGGASTAVPPAAPTTPG